MTKIAELADTYAALKAKYDKIEAEMKAAREQLLAAGKAEIKGSKAILTFKDVTTTRTDYKALAADAIDAERLAELVPAFTRETDSVRITVKPRV